MSIAAEPLAGTNARVGTAADQPAAAAPRRAPQDVMRLARLGAFHRTRLSFLDTLMRRAREGGWRMGRPLWDVDANGVGRALYTVHTGARAYTLAAFAHDLPEHARTDRVIATRWDATFTLTDGVPDGRELARLEATVPYQEAGRLTARELCLARANRSVRLFDLGVASLATGVQPDAARLAATGYLMRTTAVYGSGKFGAADRATLADRAELRGAFQAEMLTVWLIRTFTVDLVEWLAKARGGGEAAALDPALRRALGVGNSTGLGMAPFLVRHPMLINNWIAAREEALARVRAQPSADPTALERCRTAAAAATANAADWRSEDPVQAGRLTALRHDLGRIETWLAEPMPHRPFDALVERATILSLEGQEALVSILIDGHGPLVDDLADTMEADEETGFAIDGTMTVGTLRTILADRYDYALALDYNHREACARFWYTSQEKLEPRLGERFEEPGADLEEPLAVGRDAARLSQALQDEPDGAPIARFLLAHPEHRHMVRRAQIAATHPFSEIRDNLIGADLRPVDLLRCKLSFFGATRFDPRSDRWVRVNLFQDAPHPADCLAPL